MSVEFSEPPDEVLAHGVPVEKPELAQLFEDLADAVDSLAVAADAAVALVQANLDDQIELAPRMLPVGCWSYLRFNQDGYVQSGRTLNGITVEDSPTPAAAAEIYTATSAGDYSKRSTSQVFLALEDGRVEVQLTAGPYDASLFSNDGAGLITVQSRGSTYPIKFRTERLGGAIDSEPHRLYAEIMLGNSLGVGHVEDPQFVGPRWRDTVSDRAMMFDSSGLDGIDRGPRVLQVSPVASNKGVVAADEQFARMTRLRGCKHGNDGTHGQTCMETMGAAMIGHHISPEDYFHGTVVGSGSTASADFMPGTAHMQSVEKAIDALAAWVAAQNAIAPGSMELFVGSCSTIAEEDNADAVSAATYKANMEAIIDHVRDYVVASGIDGTYLGHVIQQSFQRKGAEQAADMACLAQADLLKAGICGVIGVYAMLPGLDGHWIPESYLPLGSAMAYRRAKQIEDPTYQDPFVDDGDADRVSDTRTVCTITGGDGSQFEFDTETIPNTDDEFYGISMRDDDGPVEITAVEFIGLDELQIDHAATTLADNPIVCFGTEGPAQYLPEANGARVNIRDGSAWRCPATGQIISGWMPMHEVAVT